MAKTPSTMLPLGTKAPAFKLPTPSGDWVSLDSFDDAKALVVMFICNHCPFVKHVRAELAALGRDYAPKNVGIVAINSNDIDTYPDDAPELMAREAAEAGYNFPYVFDDDQSVAKAYQAACTPDFYVFDGARTLVYRGQLDDSRPGNDQPVNGHNLRQAIDTILAGNTPDPEGQKPSIGCNIKWKLGNEPAYFG